MAKTHSRAEDNSRTLAAEVPRRQRQRLLPPERGDGKKAAAETDVQMSGLLRIRRPHTAGAWVILVTVSTHGVGLVTEDKGLLSDFKALTTPMSIGVVQRLGMLPAWEAAA